MNTAIALRKLVSSFKLNVRLTPASHRITDRWVPAQGKVFNAQEMESQNDLTRLSQRSPGRVNTALRAGDIGAWRGSETARLLPEATEAASNIGRVFSKAPGRTNAAAGLRNDDRQPAEHSFIIQAVEAGKTLGAAA